MYYFGDYGKRHEYAEPEIFLETLERHYSVWRQTLKDRFSRDEAHIYSTKN